MEPDEGSREGFRTLDAMFNEEMHVKLPVSQFSSTPGYLEKGWRRFDPKKERLVLKSFPSGPMLFNCGREGVHEVSPLHCWEKLFPLSFLNKLLSWNLTGDHAEHFHFPNGTKVNVDLQKLYSLYAHRLYIMSIASKPLGNTLRATNADIEADFTKARDFFIQNDLRPKKCGISALKSLHAHFYIPHEIEHEINSTLVSLLTPGSIPYLCGDETAPGNTGAAPFLRMDNNKPHPLSIWYQTVAVPTSLHHFEFCCRIRSFKAESSRGISDPPQGMTEEMALLAIETGGILCMDSLYATKHIVEQFPKWISLNPQCGFIASLHSGWFAPLIAHMPHDSVRQQGNWSILIRPIPQDTEPDISEEEQLEPYSQQNESAIQPSETVLTEPPQKKSKAFEFDASVAILAASSSRSQRTVRASSRFADYELEDRATTKPMVKQISQAGRSKKYREQKLDIPTGQLIEAVSDSHITQKGDTTHKFTFSSGIFELHPGPQFKKSEEKKNPVFTLYGLLFNAVDHFNKKLYNKMLTRVHRRASWRGSMDDLYFTALTLDSYHLYRVLNKDFAAGIKWTGFY